MDQLLELLKSNARLSAEELSVMLGSSVKEIENKIAEYETKGVIKGYAAIIDDYFTKYGYATKRVKVPNIHSRPFWNYVETKDCNINQLTGLNSQDTAKISSIYDHGITFWHTSNVGDYTQNNAPVGGT